MDGSLPTSLKHIISNAEYYGPSLFLLGKHMEASTSVAVEILAKFLMWIWLQGHLYILLKQYG